MTHTHCVQLVLDLEGTRCRIRFIHCHVKSRTEMATHVHVHYNRWRMPDGSSTRAQCWTGMLVEVNLTVPGNFGATQRGGLTQFCAMKTLYEQQQICCTPVRPNSVRHNSGCCWREEYVGNKRGFCLVVTPNTDENNCVLSRYT